MNKLIIRYLAEKGHTLVGVIAKRNIGEDSGLVAGLAANGVSIYLVADAESVIKQSKPDVCILATRSFLNDIYDSLVILGQNGVNTVTIAEEAFYAWNTSAQKSKELNELFKKNNATITATGIQDVYWGYLPASLVGASHKVERIEGTYRYNLDDYGRAGCKAHGAGLNESDFSQNIIQNALPTYAWNSNEWLCARLGWTVKKTSQQIYPIFADKPVHSKSLDADVPVGNSLGLKAVVTTETEHGVVIETTLIGQVYHGDMFDLCSWNISGEPKTELLIKNPATVEITCASAVNRIDKVVKAQSGYVTTDLLGLI